jgi:hypothetical protein
LGFCGPGATCRGATAKRWTPAFCVGAGGFSLFHSKQKAWEKIKSKSELKKLEQTIHPVMWNLCLKRNGCQSIALTALPEQPTQDELTEAASAFEEMLPGADPGAEEELREALIQAESPVVAEEEAAGVSTWEEALGAAVVGLTEQEKKAAEEIDGGLPNEDDEPPLPPRLSRGEDDQEQRLSLAQLSLQSAEAGREERPGTPPLRTNGADDDAGDADNIIKSPDRKKARTMSEDDLEMDDEHRPEEETQAWTE